MSAPLSVPRNPAFDFTKGMLVLLMLGYHWMNYFVSTEGAIYSYLRFVTPSFIFITGFLISNVYPNKHKSDYASVFSRLANRGTKLFVIFTTLNVFANLIFSANYRGQLPGVEGFFNRSVDVYIFGNARSLFWVLLPISYLLVIGGGLLFISRGSQLFLRSVSCLSVLCVAALSLWSISSANLEMLGAGMLGLACGSWPIKTVNRVVDHPLGISTLYAVYTLALAIWGTPYVLQLMGVCLNVALIYIAGTRCAIRRTAYDCIVTLGKYSLFGYIAQIGILHFLRTGIENMDLPTTVVWGISLVGAASLTIASVMVLDAARKKCTVIRSMYEGVFA